jgi:23S rRNA pseudouridine2605 synthase
MSDKPDRPARPRPPAKAAATDAPEGDRIAKVLSRAGIASRREAERMIELGQVTVNGKVISSPALNVTAKDRITVAGQPLGEPDPPRLWLYYKPEGLVTSAADEKGRETVFDRLPPDMPRVMSVGRLDLNSEGLLLLTNDGGLARGLELPGAGVMRRYRVRAFGRIDDADLARLTSGITIDGMAYGPIDARIEAAKGANVWLSVALREGKNRELRVVLEHLGLKVNRLIRVSYGPFQLGSLPRGEVASVPRKVLMEQLGKRGSP